MNQPILALALTVLLTACQPANGLSSVAIEPVPVSTATPAFVSQPVTDEYSPADYLATGILGNPTDTSVTINLVPAVEMELYYEYGTTPGVYIGQTVPQAAEAGVPIETILSGLKPDTRYYYRLRAMSAAGPERSFITQRAPGSTFNFAIQADSHLNTDKHCNPELYQITMGNIAATQPDFFLDLGDTFRTDKLKNINQENINKLYLDQRQYFGTVSASAPLFLVNGNHEMEWGWLLDGTNNNPAVWSLNARNMYYSEPAPDDFYSGDPLFQDGIGLLRDYYAWTWGDALFVVIDPYWSTITDPKKSGNNWDWTLGEAQYQWFRQVLETSDSVYKFVFTHHVLGETRGGVEMAKFFEWGGYNRDGSWAFDDHRPGWGMSIQQVMANNDVTIFFQGHDHLYARQELDGVIYQSVPMPADDTYLTPNQEAYTSGFTRPESGFLKVTVAPTGVTVDYIRSFLPRDETMTLKNGMVDTSYTVPVP